jgi:hypothetical protein
MLMDYNTLMHASLLRVDMVVPKDSKILVAPESQNIVCRVVSCYNHQLDEDYTPIYN